MTLSRLSSPRSFKSAIILSYTVRLPLLLDEPRCNIALPIFELLDLWLSCSENCSHDTTESCLLALSVHCKNLRQLSVDFNTADLVDDIGFLSGDQGLSSLRSLPTRCSVDSLHVGGLPFPNVTDRDVTTLAEGFADIFLSISRVMSTRARRMD